MAKKAHMPDIGVVLEDIDSKFDQMLEGLQGVQKQVDDHHQELREFREDTNYKFEAVFERFEKMDERFDRVEHKLDQKVDRSEFEARVGRLEKKLA